jgi:hypothetical protein
MWPFLGIGTPLCIPPIPKRITFDIFTAYLGVTIGVLILYLSYVFALSQYPLGITILFSCLMYILFKKKIIHTPFPNIAIANNELLKKANDLVYVILFSITIGIYYFSPSLYVRPLSYLILVSLFSLSITVDIFILKRKSSIVLLKILFLALNLQFGKYFLFPGIIGSDSGTHAGWIEKYIHYGHITYGGPELGDLTSNNGYYNFPVFHLLILSIKLLTNLGLKEAYLFGGITLIISTVFIFLIGKQISGNKAGLLAALLWVVNEHSMNFAANSIIPMTVGTCFFIMILFLLLRKDGALNTIIPKIIILYFSIVIILTHQIASFVMLIALIAMYSSEQIYSFIKRLDTKKIISSIYVLIFFIGLIAYWMNAYGAPGSEDLFGYLISSFSSALTVDAKLGSTEVISTPNVDIHSIVNDSAYLFILLFGIIGLLIWLSVEKRSIRRILLVSVFVLLQVITYGTALFGLQSIIPGRWFLFSSVILSLLSAVGILHIVNLASSVRTKTIAISAIIIFITLSCIIFSSANPDSPIPGYLAVPVVARTTSEMAASKSISNMYDGYVISDFLGGMGKRKSRTAVLKPPFESEEWKFVVIRQRILDYGIWYEKGFGVLTNYKPDKNFLTMLDMKFNKVYGNGGVWGYCRND